MKKIIILNHKSNITLENTKKYLLEINNILRNDQKNIICPSSIYIPYYIGKNKFDIGIQKIDYENKTSFLTGNILKSCNVKYALIGHPELKQSEEEINFQIKESLNNNITPIIIFSDTYYNYELKKSGAVITKQIKEYLKDIKVEQDLLFAYIPNFKYTGKQIPKLSHIEDITNLIRSVIKRNYQVNPKVLYGGKITNDGIKEFDKLNIVDGYIIEKQSTSLKDLKELLTVIE